MSAVPAPSRSRTRAVRAVALTVLIAGYACPAGASALTVDTVPLTGTGIGDDGFPSDLAVRPDGNLRVLLERSAPRRSDDREVVIGPRDLIGAPLQILAPSPTQGEVTFGALTGSGAIVTFRSNRLPRPKLRAVLWENGKQVGRQTISDPAHAFRGGWLSAAPNGAATVRYSQHLGGGRWAERVAVRPAGATRFLPPVAATPTEQPANGPANDTVGDQTYWGPNGDGALVWFGATGTGHTALRRISRDGEIGPAIPLPLTDITTGGTSAITIGADGTILIVRQTAKYGEWIPEGDDGEHRRIDAKVDAFTVPAGSNTPTDPVVLRQASGWAGDEIDAYTVSAALSAEGRVIVAIDGGRQRIELLEGSLANLGGLRSAASFANHEWAGYGDFTTLFTTDGGAAVFWGAQTMTTARGPEGAWSSPRLMLPKLRIGVSVLEHAQPLPDGGVAGIVLRAGAEVGELSPSVARIHR